MFAVCVCMLWWLHLCAWTAHATPMSLRPRLGGSAGGRRGSGFATPVGATVAPSPTSFPGQGNGLGTIGSGTFATGSIASNASGVSVFSASGGETQGILIACQNQVCVSENEEYACDNLPSTIGDDIAWLYSDGRTQRPVLIQESGITRNENGIPINFAAVGNQPPITCNVVAATSASTFDLPPVALAPRVGETGADGGDAAGPGEPFGSCCLPCPRLTAIVQPSLSCCRACPF
ncbi:hypothetical protein FGB62_230g00 [Gracilaria domingensis]|nr:hypothetical protein FGB62_230g00 [Gracilaria domingensis]